MTHEVVSRVPPLNSNLASAQPFTHHQRQGMKVGQTNRSRILASLALTLMLLALGMALCLFKWQPAEGLLRSSYDSLHSLQGANSEVADRSPVVIVYLDLNSFGLLNQDPTQPWSRALHAQLLQKLVRSGARAVVFDIVFSAAGSNATADDALAGAIRESQRTILAGEASGKISHVTSGAVAWTRSSTVSPPWEKLATAAAGWGIASHIVDDDYGVRRYVAGGFGPEGQPSLTWAAAAFLQLPITRAPNAMQRANNQGIRYYGPPLTIPHVSYADALSADGTPAEFFRDKIVFIGARPLTELFRGRQDEFRSPFHSWQYKEFFLPGVEVHATEMLNLIRNDGLQRTSVLAETLFVTFAALLFGGGLVWLRPIPATLAALVGGAIALGLSLAMFSRGIWFPWLVICGAQIPAALSGSVLYYSVEWYRARKRFEAAKRLADAKIREQAALIDKAHDAIMVQDLAGNFLYINPSAEKLYGWKADELGEAELATTIFQPDAEAAAGARKKTFSSGEWNGELRQQTKAGDIVTVASRWTLIRDDAGQPKALLLINSDITEQKLLEQQFLRTQRMNTIGTLAGGMAHDLNNALAPVLLGAQLLRRKTEDAESRNLLTLIETSAHRGAEMVRQVLLFARGHGGEFERLELSPIIKEIEQMVRETFPSKIAVERYVPPDLWPARGNVTQLHQVLLNLCVNARDAMPDGGKLSLAADNVELSAAEAAEIPEGRPGSYVTVMVSDTGTGMSPAVQAKIFEPFFTTKAEGQGTGIGLPTVLRIVKAHEGFMRVASAAGEGTTFEIFLPRATESASAPAPVATDIPRGRGELILVVDDERAVRELVGDGLLAHGFRALIAANGDEAIELFNRHREEIRVLLTDNAMPLRDGAQTIAALRSAKPTLPVILASADPELETRAEGGRINFLRKPFSLEELLTAVARALET